MKASRTEDTITVEMSIKEAALLHPFIEFATRRSMNWTYEGDFGKRWLQVDPEDKPRGRQALGLKETRRLAVLLDPIERDNPLISEAEAMDVWDAAHSKR